VKNSWFAAAVVGAMVFGADPGLAAKVKVESAGISAIKGKPAQEAGLAALAEAERLAAKQGSWELIAIGRVYYLSGDKARGQAIFDRVTDDDPGASDWQRIGEVYDEAGEKTRAEECFQKVIILKPRDDTALAEIGGWYIRNGQREKGEHLLERALKSNPDELWHYVRAAEGLLGVAAGR